VVAAPVDTLAARDSARARDSVRVADSLRVTDSLRVADSVRAADSAAAALAAASAGGWVRILGDLPEDAVMWFNGRPRRGRFLAVPPGRYTLEVETTEFEPWEREIVVRPGDTLRVRVQLELKQDN
jgi:hypothetical protein